MYYSFEKGCTGNQYKIQVVRDKMNGVFSVPITDRKMIPCQIGSKQKNTSKNFPNNCEMIVLKKKNKEDQELNSSQMG